MNKPKTQKATTTDDNERYVRGRWIYAEVRSSSAGDRYYINLGGVKLLANEYGEGYDSPPETWSQARAFTEARLEQIRQVEEEVRQLVAYRDGRIKWVATGYMGYPDAQHEADVFQRILVREQGVLAELRRGTEFCTRFSSPALPLAFPDTTPHEAGRRRYGK